MISLEVHQLSKVYSRKTVFTDLSFSHTEGVLGIAGVNGSGKSTLLRCLAYLLRPTAGSIIWRKDDSGLTRQTLKATIGYAAPYLNLYSDLTAGENLTFLQEVSGLSPASGSVEELLSRVQMPAFKNHLIKELSTGQVQRIKLAAALVKNPEILLLDEPGSNLDKKGHQLVSEIIEERVNSGGLVIVASNDPAEIAMCSQVVKLSNH